jgi:hypothetical protein
MKPFCIVLIQLAENIPDDFGQRFNIRFNFIPVLPNLIKKPIFE